MGMYPLLCLLYVCARTCVHDRSNISCQVKGATCTADDTIASPSSSPLADAFKTFFFFCDHSMSEAVDKQSAIVNSVQSRWIVHKEMKCVACKRKQTGAARRLMVMDHDL